MSIGCSSAVGEESNDVAIARATAGRYRGLGPTAHDDCWDCQEWRGGERHVLIVALTQGRGRLFLAPKECRKLLSFMRLCDDDWKQAEAESCRCVVAAVSVQHMVWKVPNSKRLGTIRMGTWPMARGGEPLSLFAPGSGDGFCALHFLWRE